MSAGSDYVRHLAELRGIIEARDVRPGDVIMRRCEGELDRSLHYVETRTPEPGRVELTFTDGCSCEPSPTSPLSLVMLAESADLTAFKIGGAL